MIGGAEVVGLPRQWLGRMEQQAGVAIAAKVKKS
jgi:hypothetical protein